MSETVTLILPFSSVHCSSSFKVLCACWWPIYCIWNRMLLQSTSKRYTKTQQQKSVSNFIGYSYQSDAYRLLNTKTKTYRIYDQGVWWNGQINSSFQPLFLYSREQVTLMWDSSTLEWQLFLTIKWDDGMFRIAHARRCIIRAFHWSWNYHFKSTHFRVSFTLSWPPRMHCKPLRLCGEFYRILWQEIIAVLPSGSAFTIVYFPSSLTEAIIALWFLDDWYSCEADCSWK